MGGREELCGGRESPGLMKGLYLGSGGGGPAKVWGELAGGEAWPLSWAAWACSRARAELGPESPMLAVWVLR